MKHTLKASKEANDKPACKALLADFQIEKDRYREIAAKQIKQLKELEHETQQEQLGITLLEEVDKVASAGAGLRIAMWNHNHENNQCKNNAATIGYLAVQQLLKVGQSKGDLEKWLMIPNLSDLHETPRNTVEGPDGENTNRTVQYDDSLSTGDKEIVDALMLELDKYLPLCTSIHTRNLNGFRKWQQAEGTATAPARVNNSKKATEAIEKSLSNNETAAAHANKKASIPKHHPKGKGGQMNSMSKPTLKKGSHSQSKTNGKESKRKGYGKGSENGSKRKQQEPHQKRSPAKHQDDEPDDAQSPQKSKRQRRHPITSNSSPTATTTTTTSEKPASSNNNMSLKRKKQGRKRRDSQGGSNKQGKRKSNPN